MRLDKFDNSYLRDISNSIRENMQGLIIALQPLVDTINQIRAVTEPFLAKWNNIAATIVEAMKPAAAINKMRNNQYVYWDYLPLEFVDELLSEKNTNKVLRKFEMQNRWERSETVIDKCRDHRLIQEYVLLYDQTIDSYHNKHYNLAVVGITALIDGVLAKTFSNPKNHKILESGRALVDKFENDELLDDKEYSLLSLILTFDSMTKSFGGHSDFSKREPTNLNRHWIMHGRAKRKRNRLDCIKLIYYLYAITIIYDKSNDISQ